TTVASVGGEELPLITSFGEKYEWWFSETLFLPPRYFYYLPDTFVDSLNIFVYQTLLLSLELIVKMLELKNVLTASQVINFGHLELPDTFVDSLNIFVYQVQFLLSTYLLSYVAFVTGTDSEDARIEERVDSLTGAATLRLPDS
nr:mannosyl-oligosaccharide glucosidase GCS1-like [Tanacetum cinerariifolium]